MRIKQKRVFIIHGWDGSPNEGWFPWLKKELENKGFSVRVPAMPKPEKPKIENWVNYLSKKVGRPDKNTYFVGHSIGCQTILRYLETLPSDKKAGGAVFVAGWFTLKNLETKEEKEISKPWLEVPINFKKIKKHTNKFVAIFSDNDPFVPISNKNLFKKRLNAKIIIEHKKGHFDGSDNIPGALKAVLYISTN